MDAEQKERYVRWQNYRIQQLTFSINLFLGFAVASLAYVINFKLTNHLTPDEQVMLICPILWWSGSITVGCVCSISRLLDFRYTARKIKDSSACDKKLAKILGRITWWAFFLQVITYLVGGYLFLVRVVL